MDRISNEYGGNTSSRPAGVWGIKNIFYPNITGRQEARAQEQQTGHTVRRGWHQTGWRNWGGRNEWAGESSRWVTTGMVGLVGKTRRPGRTPRDGRDRKKHTRKVIRATNARGK